MSVEASASAGGTVAADAIEAWRRCGAGTSPRAVDLIKGPRRKSTVLRLHGAGPAGEPVIAKRCPTEAARVERTVYERVLPALPVASLRLYGASDGGDGSTWLFVEDAGDVRWSPKLPEHDVLAVEWLAAAQLAAAELVGTVALPARDTDYHLGLLHSAQDVVAAALANDAIDAGGRKLLRGLGSDYAALEARWDVLERLWNRFPRTLALPGLSRKNVRIRTVAHGAVFAVFDFESAGWGVPAIEIARVDLDRYLDAIASRWSPDRADAARLATIGSGLWSIKSIGGEAAALTSPWASRALGKLALYATRVSAALGVLDAGRNGGRHG